MLCVRYEFLQIVVFHYFFFCFVDLESCICFPIELDANFGIDRCIYLYRRSMRAIDASAVVAHLKTPVFIVVAHLKTPVESIIVEIWISFGGTDAHIFTWIHIPRVSSTFNTNECSDTHTCIGFFLWPGLSYSLSLATFAFVTKRRRHIHSKVTHIAWWNSHKYHFLSNTNTLFPSRYEKLKRMWHWLWVRPSVVCVLCKNIQCNCRCVIESCVWS